MLAARGAEREAAGSLSAGLEHPAFRGAHPPGRLCAGDQARPMA